MRKYLRRASSAMSLLLSGWPFASIEIDHFGFSAWREFETIARECSRCETADLPEDLDMHLSHRGAIGVAHRCFDSLDQPRALFALFGRQQCRACEHVAMERATILFQQHQRNDRSLDQQYFIEKKCVDLPARQNS